MTGCFTDNQPDFTWIQPQETKNFKQYFMPYKNIGYVKNATIDAAVNAEYDETKGQLTVSAYTTSVQKRGTDTADIAGRKRQTGKGTV
jgi:hypothetical protein